MRARCLLALALLLAAAPAARAATLLDAVVAEVEGAPVAASEIALARALGLLGFAPSEGPVERAEVERLVDLRLILAEAERLGIVPAPHEVERAWQELARRVGGPPVLEAWAATQRVDPGWVRRLLAAGLVRQEFIEIRFRAFVFVTEPEVAAALGPGSHGEGARVQARAALVEERVARSLREWLTEARARARLRILDLPRAPIRLPAPAGLPTR